MFITSCFVLMTSVYIKFRRSSVLGSIILLSSWYSIFSCFCYSLIVFWALLIFVSFFSLCCLESKAISLMGFFYTNRKTQHDQSQSGQQLSAFLPPSSNTLLGLITPACLPVHSCFMLCSSNTFCFCMEITSLMCYVLFLRTDFPKL